MYGVENSDRRKKNQQALDNLLTELNVIPIFPSLAYYAKEKARLRIEQNKKDAFFVG